MHNRFPGTITVCIDAASFEIPRRQRISADTTATAATTLMMILCDQIMSYRWWAVEIENRNDAQK
jgi:hypothetical protein